MFYHHPHYLPFDYFRYSHAVSLRWYESFMWHDDNAPHALVYMSTWNFMRWNKRGEKRGYLFWLSPGFSLFSSHLLYAWDVYLFHVFSYHVMTICFLIIIFYESMIHVHKREAGSHLFSHFDILLLYPKGSLLERFLLIERETFEWILIIMIKRIEKENGG